MRRRRQITCLVGGIYVYDDGCHNTFCLLRVGKIWGYRSSFALHALLRSLCTYIHIIAKYGNVAMRNHQVVRSWCCIASEQGSLVNPQLCSGRGCHPLIGKLDQV
jgi:hypothetical protein